MPYYDYRCNDCHRKVTLFYKTYAAYDAAAHTCPRCGGANLTRLISRVAIARSEEARFSALEEDAALADLDENDPVALGRLMRKMSREVGEELPDEFDEVVGRLESGESPEDIEASMPDLSAMPGDGDAVPPALADAADL